MTDMLPVPLPHVPEHDRSVARPHAVTPFVGVLARTAETVLPLLGDLIRRRLASVAPSRAPTLGNGFVFVESLQVRVVERADGTREWQLEHLTLGKPRPRKSSGPWAVLLSALAVGALVASRIARSRWTHR
ncbi:MAG: hypothetical protein RMH81_01040 [Thermomicrobium sp.]|nr:hypothetical protein [Thermomicrobium sp.]